MAATVQLRRWTGSTPTKTDVTGGSTRLNAMDDASPGTSNPVRIPDLGTNYSYWASFQLYADTAPSNEINNIKFYTDGSDDLGTGIGLNVATATSYVQATGTEGTSGDELTTGNHTSLNASPSDAFGYTSGSPLSVSGSTSTTGDFGDQMVLQMTVDSTAGSGASASESMSVSYDET